MIRTWNKYFESLIIPGLKIDEFLNGLDPAGKAHKNILSIFFNTYENYIDIDDPAKHIFKVNDLTGDILNNGRVQFNAMVFGKQELETVVRNNIVNLSMNEFYSNLPNNINIFGIDLKPISFVNKDDLKFSFENLLTIDELKRIITSVSGYTFSGERDGYYIWRKNV
jgi:hypothetical protein